mgnify:FL=1|tara:strand:- start:7484 stop:8587 length:1104 start_codon:yes stop_codon:yes gene_type:complete
MSDKPKSRWLINAQEFGNLKNPKRDTSDVKQFDLGEENLYNKGFVIHVEHVPTKREVEFSAFVTDQSDAFTSTWTEETVFGRMDPIATFESTKRVATLGFTVPAYSRRQAVNNLSRINSLLSFLYPTYTDGGAGAPQGVGTTLNMGPLVRIKYANLISNTDNPSKGLLGYITTGITVTPNMEAGVFAAQGDTKTGIKLDGPEILYKAYDLNFELTVLHEHSLGFTMGHTHGGRPGFVFRNRKGHFPFAMGEKVHLPYTVHGMDFSEKMKGVAATRARQRAAAAERARLESYGKPNSARRKRNIALINASGVSTATLTKFLQPMKTGYNLSTASGRTYALQSISQKDFNTAVNMLQSSSGAKFSFGGK